MPSEVVRCNVPVASLIYPQVTRASFIDAQQVVLADSHRPAMACFLDVMAGMPGWIDNLMALRNRVVQAFGLKDLGRLTRIDRQRDPASYQPGERVGVFTLIRNTAEEVLLVDRDKHLDVYISLLCKPATVDDTRTVVVSTVVHTHNLLGRLYMLPVAPFHRFIAPIALGRLLRTQP
ncbi:DUF2867 domain-containing protein [Pseudomonas sp. GD03860]|uniref:DUF2867 domain-containing protein n=1 Tax=Pseudomonas TaxID=286 RepID=UPI0023635DA5|nr:MULTISPECIES: DUF2867 domain-containing protein [Pseudomonas]MDD2058269.1 DUF2867 domain-containing protein [Pseudomonas putida]MDH0636202.1 DUF2867 domain-containing protein [Pseudomonas sp. GD03860]